MSVEKNKATLRRVAEEVFNKGNLSIIPELIASDYIYHSPLGDYKGPEGFKQMVVETRTAFPDFHMKIDDMVAEGEKMAVRLTMTATHKGEYMGVPPTGKKINFTAAYFYRYKDGKEVEALPFMDMLTFYRQLGIPVPQQ